MTFSIQAPTVHMHLCILENDDLDPPLVPKYTRVATMFERLFAQVGYQGRIDIFSGRQAYDWLRQPEPHDGLALARFMIRFVQYGLSGQVVQALS